jgi:Uri superfamily endonuclease
MMKLDHRSILPEDWLQTSGIYFLIINVDCSRTISIGKRYLMNFPEGYCAYVGSAMAGFGARLGHHFKGASKPRWHIDYLLHYATIHSVIICETNDKAECIFAQALAKRFGSITRFGCSDCRCSSHLFISADKELLCTGILETVSLLGYQAELINLN